MHAVWAFVSLALLSCPSPAFSEIKMAEGKNFTLTTSPYIRTDVIAIENNNDLDTRKRDDRVQYIGFDYSLAFDLAVKDAGPRFYFKVERNGLYDYDAPLIVNNTLNTYLGKVAPYNGAELLPYIEEFWADIPLFAGGPARLRAGLFTYQVGHGIALTGSYENYGIDLYTQSEHFNWHLYFCWPDYATKNLSWPYIKQQKPQGIDYEHAKAYFFATDMLFKLCEGNSIQPYAGLLLDYSDGKRFNYFQTPTRRDGLGTIGISWNLSLDKFSASLEWAKNFGGANSIDQDFPDVEHRGWAVYADGSYDLEKVTPRSRFIYASGNTLTCDMVANGDTRYPSGKNNAFSVYSPLNANLADSIYAPITALPLVAMGPGWGMNYGVQRPTTFNDPGIVENLILVNAGLDYRVTPKVLVSLDWWYLASAEKGIGMFNNVPKVISPELGNEADVSVEFAASDYITFTVFSGVFFPGAAYREERDDTSGSLFTPFVRGDGKADPAYQIEASLEFMF
jgi:hypothetical protein